jgi:3-hydroxyisobutyrate dehydrogenase
VKVGVAGLGRMGSVLAARLLDAGHEVVVWNRSPAAADSLAAAGARVVGSPAELAAAADVVAVLVTDDAAVRRVWTAADGLLAGSVAGKLLIESSTVAASTVAEVAAAARAKGAAVVDLPVSGTVAPARAGQLLGLAGGAPDDVARAGEVFAVWCRKVVHLGPAGSGIAAKLALNMAMACLWAALGESYALAEAAGIERSAFTDVLLDSPLAGPAVVGKADLLRTATVPTADVPSFDVAGVRKDLVAMVTTAAAAGVPAAVAAAALAQFSGAVATGHGSADLVAVLDYLHEARA